MDSGACDAAMPPEMVPGISLVSTSEPGSGMEYEVANGEGLPNLGEKRCIMMTDNPRRPSEWYSRLRMSTRHCLVSEELPTGVCECTLGKVGGKPTDVVTGDLIPLHRRSRLYVMRAWVRQDQGFGRPA